MPLYDYKCSKCGYIFEVQQRITEDPLKHCPKCKGHIKRLISPAGIIFKGSGFHVTDYSSKPAGASPPKEKPKEKKEAKKEKKAEKPSKGKEVGK
jgi:putative FmdB family regulatory protein